MSVTTTTTTTSDQPTVVQMSQQGAEIFIKAVNHILNNWPSLDLAIENGMGGRDNLEKRKWMIATLTNDMLKGKDIDVEYYLEELIDEEFNTRFEDGSLEYNAKWIEKFYKDCLMGKDQDVLYAITQASLKKMSLDRVKIPAPVCQTNPDDESDSAEDDEDDEA